MLQDTVRFIPVCLHLHLVPVDSVVGVLHKKKCLIKCRISPQIKTLQCDIQNKKLIQQNAILLNI